MVEISIRKKTNINELYDELETLVKADDTGLVIACIQNYDGSLPGNCKRKNDIEAKLSDLLDPEGGRYFRFNHGTQYFSTTIFKDNGTHKYKSQFNRAVELIRYGRNSKAIMQVILHDMIQGNIAPIPATISVALVPKKNNDSHHDCLDVIAFYRKQEFSTWWPLNILELYYLRNKAITELKKYKCYFDPGNIVTISIQGYWDEDVSLANKSLLDDEEKAQEISLKLIDLFNFSADLTTRLNACNEIIEALKEKSEVTSKNSYDTIGLGVFFSNLKVGARLLDTTIAVKNDTLEKWKNTRNKIELLLKNLITELDSCSTRHNSEMADMKMWRATAKGLFENIIGNFEELKQYLEELKKY